MQIQTLLVPIDFSDCSAALVSDAASLARSLAARVVLLNVVDAPPGVPGGAVVSTAHGRQSAWTALEEEAQERLDAVPVDAAEVQRVVWRGRPVDGILSAADELGADLIAMGTHGRKGVAHLVLGSVAEQVIREAKVPVLTIRSVHRAGCEAGSCSWCRTRMSSTAEQLAFEHDG